MAGSMTVHWIIIYGTDLAIYRNWILVSQTEHLLWSYDARFPKITTQCPCSFRLWLVSSWNWNMLRNNFNRNHWGYSIRIQEKHPFPSPKCDRCRSQVPRGGLIATTMSQRSDRLERRDGFGARPYSTALRQFGSPFSRMRSNYNLWNPFRTSDALSYIITSIGRPYTTTYRRLGDGGGWYLRCWQRREQHCGPVGCCIKQWHGLSYFMVLIVVWWQ